MRYGDEIHSLSVCCLFVLGRVREGQDREGAGLIVLFSYSALSKGYLTEMEQTPQKKGVGLKAVCPISSPRRKPLLTGLIYSSKSPVPSEPSHVAIIRRTRTHTYPFTPVIQCMLEFLKL